MEEEKNTFKVCPLFATQPVKLHNVKTLDAWLESEHTKLEIGCMEDRCAWWGADACVVVELSVVISITLRHLEELVEKRKE